MPADGQRLKKWIEKRRREWNVQRGFNFTQTPLIEIEGKIVGTMLGPASKPKRLRIRYSYVHGRPWFR